MLITGRSKGRLSMAAELSLDSLRIRNRRFALGGIFVALACSAGIGLLMVRSGNLIAVVGTVSGLLITAGVAVWLWNRPIRGVFVVFGAAVVLATYDDPGGLVDYIGSYLPFFQDIKSWSGVGLVFSLGEVVMLLTLAAWLFRGVASRRLSFQLGSLALPLGLYMALVAAAEAHGVATGGSFRTSLFEVRSQIYALIAYVLVCNLIKNRRNIRTLMWILLLGAGARAIEGTIYFLFVLKASNHYQHQLYPHEQSYFFNAFLTLTIILFLFGGERRMKQVAVALLPFVVVANLANNRRASIAALIIALPIVLVLTAITQRRTRRAIGLSLAVLTVALIPYFVVYHSKSGLLSLPARAITSTIHPSANDASSDRYRVEEDYDIMATVKSSPILGYGFGKAMLTPYTLPKIGYNFQLIMPHNSILWVWMRLGTLGYILLWILIGTAMVQATHLIVTLRDRWLQGVALFVLVMLIQQIIISYYDLQWSNYRTMIVTGVLFGLLSTIAAIARDDRLKPRGVVNSESTRARRGGRSLALEAARG